MATHQFRWSTWRQAEIARVAERHILSARVDDVLDERISAIRDRLADLRDINRLRERNTCQTSAVGMCPRRSVADPQERLGT